MESKWWVFIKMQGFLSWQLGIVNNNKKKLAAECKISRWLDEE